jgi:hypothetical protein
LSPAKEIAVARCSGHWIVHPASATPAFVQANYAAPQFQEAWWRLLIPTHTWLVT